MYNDTEKIKPKILDHSPAKNHKVPDICSSEQANKKILAQGNQIELSEKYLGQISLNIFAYCY